MRTTVSWRIHLRSTPARVYEMLATPDGRSRFWAESAEEQGGVISFVFPDAERWDGRILEATRPHRFAIDYFGSTATFSVDGDGRDGTDLTLTHVDLAPDMHAEVLAGWVSVLMSLKAAVDFGVDLRNHDPARTWATGYADN